MYTFIISSVCIFIGEWNANGRECQQQGIFKNAFPKLRYRNLHIYGEDTRQETERRTIDGSHGMNNTFIPQTIHRNRSVQTAGARC